MSEIQHDTIVVHRTFEAPRQRVFAAWEDPAALERWCCPGDNGWTGRLAEQDFRVGGRKRMTFGPADGPTYTEETRYVDIVRDERIICAETILRGSERISASLITLAFEANGNQTTLTVTDQIAVLNRADTPEARRHGWGEVLDKLVSEVASV